MSIYRSTTSDDFGGYPGGDPYHANAPPPPAGFRSEFAPNTGSPFGASCGGEQAGFGSTAAGGRPGSGAGGFWTGAAAGGLLGYMFGNRGYCSFLCRMQAAKLILSIN